MDPVLAEIMRLPRPGPTGPRAVQRTFSECLASGATTGPRRSGERRLVAHGGRIYAVTVEDDALSVAAAAAVAAMMTTDSAPPACPYCETAIPPAPMPSTDTPLEAPSPSSDTPDCGGSCDCSCGGDQ